MHEALRLSASDFIMADAQRIGGVTGWLRAAALAQTLGRELSGIGLAWDEAAVRRFRIA